MTDDLRARIAAALRRHDRNMDGANPAHDASDEFDCCVDAVMAVLEAEFMPLRALTPDAEITPEQAEAWQAAWDELAKQPTTILVAPPNAVMIRRRSPGGRLRYLTEHRDEALANGIPADLIDMLVADAETGGPE